MLSNTEVIISLNSYLQKAWGGGSVYINSSTTVLDGRKAEDGASLEPSSSVILDIRPSNVYPSMTKNFPLKINVTETLFTDEFLQATLSILRALETINNLQNKHKISFIA